MAKVRNRRIKRDDVKISIRDAEVARRQLRILLDDAARRAESPTEKGAIQYTALIYLSCARDEKIARYFLGTTRGQRYQWKRRVVDAIWPKASPELRTFLAHAGPYVMGRRSSSRS